MVSLKEEMSTRLTSSAPRTDASPQSSMMGEPAAASPPETEPRAMPNGEQDSQSQDPQFNEDIVIRVRDLVVGFGDKTVLDHLDLDVYRGEVLGVIGASGSGKSVLTRAIIGLIPKR